MQRTMEETNRRREIQIRFNKENGLTPTPLVKSKKMIIEATKVADGNLQSRDKNKTSAEQKIPTFKNTKEAEKKIKELEKKMRKHAKNLDFMEAARIRDLINEIKNDLKK